MSIVLDDIKSGSFAQVYLLYGEEAYLRNDRRDRLLKALMPEQADMNYTRYVGKDIDTAQVISLGSTMPFFAERRLILIEDSEWFRSSHDDMADFIKELPDYLVIVFCEAQVDRKYRLYKAVSSAGHVEECARQKPEALVSWIAAYLGHVGGKKITKSAASYLLNRIGEDMFRLKTEMDKLISYTAGAQAVREQDIDAICSVTVSDRIFDMLRAITNRDQKKALDLYADLLALKEAPVKILVLLGRQFTQVLYAKELTEQRLSQSEMASLLGVRPFMVRSLVECAGKFELQELEEAVRDTAEADEAIKTGRMSDLLAAELLIVRYSSRKRT